MQESQLIRKAASFAGRGRCRKGRRLCLVLGAAVMLALAMAQAAFAAPDPPVLTAIDPASPANANNPKVKGTVGAGSPTSVKIFTNANCTEPSAGTGTVADFTGAGIPVLVPDDSTTAFRARAVDGTGVESGCSNSIPFVEDSTAPETTIDSGPSGTIATDLVDFTFSSNEPATFQCTLDGVSESCSVSKVYSRLSDGQHTFSVIATDAAGNVDPSKAVSTFVVEASAPNTVIDSGPSGTIATSSVTFTFSSNEMNAAFECTLDGVAESCSSPKTYDGLSQGPHTFSVRATDQALKVDPSPATASFTVDVPFPPQPIPPAPVVTSVVAARPAASFVLIAGRTISVTRKRFASIGLNCSGTKNCAGVLTLTTARRVRVTRKRRRIVKLGSIRFTIPARQTAEIKVRLSKRKFRLLRRLRRVAAVVTVTDRDNAGRARIGTRVVNLRAL